MRARSSLALAMALMGTLASCRDSSPTGPAGNPTDGRVFIDNFISADFQAFAGSDVAAISVDNTVRYRGSSSIKVTVPGPGSFAGGAFVASVPRDLSRYNALTFYTRASVNATLNVGGTANDNTGNSRFMVERNNIPVTTAWQKVVIPIPSAARLDAEAGLFYFAEGAEGATGYELWFDDIRFETLSDITNARPAVTPATVVTEVGATQQIGNIPVTFSVAGADVTVSAMPSYFSFTSSNPTVATVNESGLISVIAGGTANITAALGATVATGQIGITATAPPTVAAPTPTRDAAEVISLFSNAYTNVAVDTWSTTWDVADVSDVTVGGNAAKRYANFVYAGIETIATPVNLTTMTHMHLDVYVNDPAAFRVKLVDLGANGVFGGGDEVEHEVTFGPATVPAITAGGWVSLDIPLSAFAGLTTRAALGQIILSGSSSVTYIDNVYFYRVPAPVAPVAPAPTPAYAAGDVISMFSDAYTNVSVATWSPEWDGADVADASVSGNAMKRYSNLVYAVVDFGATYDATTMTHFRMDFWTPDASLAPNAFNVKLVDFGADGVYNAPGSGPVDDVEHEISINATSTPALTTGSWITLDIPLSQFTGLTTRAHLAQIVIVGVEAVNTVFIDNVLLHR